MWKHPPKTGQSKLCCFEIFRFSMKCLWFADQCTYCTTGDCSALCLSASFPPARQRQLTELHTAFILREFHVVCKCWESHIHPASLFLTTLQGFFKQHEALASSCLCIPPWNMSHPWADHEPHNFLSSQYPIHYAQSVRSLTANTPSTKTKVEICSLAGAGQHIIFTVIKRLSHRWDICSKERCCQLKPALITAPPSLLRTH